METKDNNYLYNYKELNADHDLKWYDYGARFYDAVIGRWHVVDPMGGDFNNWTPYHYVHCNPLKYSDIGGMSAEDKIDIDKKSGNITVTAAKGKDEVRLINDGKVESSYVYGENGSFCKENDIKSDDNGTAVIMTDENKAQKFYQFAAQSNVEFGKLDVEKNGTKLSVVTTSHDATGIETLPGLVKAFSASGFTGIKQSHSHPGTITTYNESVPSGHYDYLQGNPNSLMPYLNKKGKNEGDALNAIQVRGLKGFKNTKFELYAPGNKTKTSYDVVNKAKISKYQHLSWNTAFNFNCFL